MGEQTLAGTCNGTELNIIDNSFLCYYYDNVSNCYRTNRSYPFSWYTHLKTTIIIITQCNRIKRDFWHWITCDLWHNLRDWTFFRLKYEWTNGIDWPFYNLIRSANYYIAVVIPNMFGLENQTSRKFKQKKKRFGGIRTSFIVWQYS